MSEWITQKGKTMPALGQPTKKECWITCYQMILHAYGFRWDLETIQKRLEAGGLSNAKVCRTAGIGDPELTKAATALKMSSTTTSNINSLGGIKNMLMMGGPLWVAGVFETKEQNTVTDYHHVIVVIGVDEDHQTVCCVDPWKENTYDIPCKAWLPWNYIKKSIQKTLYIEGSLQFLSGPGSAALLLS